MKCRPIWIGVCALVILLATSAAVDQWTFMTGSSGRQLEADSSHEEEGAPRIDARLTGTGRPLRAEQVGPYSLEGRRVAVPEGNALKVVDALKVRAESGDGNAALMIYLKLRECQTVLVDAPSDAELAMYQEMGAARALEEAQLTILGNCEDAADLLDGHAKWLEMAADSGVEEAQLLFALDPGPLLGRVDDAIRDPEAVQAYKHKAMRYLNGLAGRGNIEGVQALANAYGSGILAPADAERAYAYYRMAELMNPGLYDPEFMSVQRGRVPPGRLAGADDLAHRLYSRCCQR